MRQSLFARLTRRLRRLVRPTRPTPSRPAPSKPTPAKPILAKAKRGSRRSRPARLPVPEIENFALIIGAMKCGSTSLYDYLATHPQIAPCRWKEPNFFNGPRWKHGPDYYRRLWQDHDPERHCYALEASPSYTKQPLYRETTARIAAFPADFKFLYVVRDPIDRIESNIAHNIAKGLVSAGNYQRLLRQAAYTSCYAFQLDGFPKPDLLVLDFNELKHQPLALLDRCSRFLGLDAGFEFTPRPPANVRHAVNGIDAFRLSPEERARLQRRLHRDVLRFADTYEFDISAWDFPATAPKPARRRSAAASPRPSLPPVRVRPQEAPETGDATMAPAAASI